MAAIIHISDLHFGKQSVEVFSDKSKLARSIFDAIRTELTAAKDRLLLVSGDLIYQGNENIYPEVREFLSTLCGLAGIPRNHVAICPGNHDIVATFPPSLGRC